MGHLLWAAVGAAIQGSIFDGVDPTLLLGGGACCLVTVGLLFVVILFLVLRSGGKKKNQPRSSAAAPARSRTPAREASAGRRPGPEPQLPLPRWTLVIERGADIGLRFPVRDSVRIGRAPDNQMQLRDGLVSRHHAHIEPDGDACYIADLDSGNGTFVNGRRIGESTWLQAGDEIEVGDTMMRLVEGTGVPEMDSGGYAPVSVAPQEAPAAYVAPAPQPVVPEPVLDVLPALERRKGLMRTQSFNLVLTSRRLVFARLTSEMLQEASKQAKAAAKAQGKGFFGQWGAMFDANGRICEQYKLMPVEKILAQHSDNFFIAVDEVRKVEVKRGWRGSADDDSQPDPDEVIIHANSKHTFALKGTKAAQARRTLKAVLGDVVK